MLEQLSESSRSDYLRHAHTFLATTPHLLCLPHDIDLRIRERTMIVSRTLSL